MQEFCHRCSSELPIGEAGAGFCPHCGAPQLFLRDYDAPAKPLEAGGRPVAAPPGPDAVDWRIAIRSAALVGVVAGLLALGGIRFALLSGLSSAWFVGGSLVALALYQKWRPGAWMDGKVGARIGLLVGLSLALGLMASMAVGGLIARYGLHAMGDFDKLMTAQQMQMTAARDAAGNPLPGDWVRFFQTAEFRAGMMLGGLGMVTTMLLVLSTIGGTLAGIARTRKALH